jgi:hypothetical protein
VDSVEFRLSLFLLVVGVTGVEGNLAQVSIGTQVAVQPPLLLVVREIEHCLGRFEVVAVPAEEDGFLLAVKLALIIVK